MKILIQGARILDPQSAFHLKEKNVLISNGRIAEIGDKNFTADKTIKATGMTLSPGWFDLATFISDPGMEHKEDLISGAEAAMAGGFTGLAMLPNTSPAVQSKNEISYITRSNSHRLVQIHALAAVTRNNKGEELTEMIDLHNAGAVAFTDGLKPLWHTDIFLKSLQYLQKFNGLLIDHPEDIWLNMFGQMNEGTTSTMLGLKGLPRIAEDIVISKSLELLAYAGGRLHLSRLSTAKAIDQVRNGKKKLKLTCDITSYQAILDDSMLTGFDTNYKVNPPLREKSDIDAIIKGLKDNTIDVICSGHAPQDEESKNIEFDLAEFGIINLQTFGSNLVTLSKHVDWEVLIPKITTNPRQLLGLPSPAIAEEQSADLTLFDPEKKWVLNESTNRSKSKNSPFFGRELTGKAVAVFNNGKSWIDNQA